MRSTVPLSIIVIVVSIIAVVIVVYATGLEGLIASPKLIGLPTFHRLAEYPGAAEVFAKFPRAPEQYLGIVKTPYLLIWAKGVTGVAVGVIVLLCLLQAFLTRGRRICVGREQVVKWQPLDRFEHSLLLSSAVCLMITGNMILFYPNFSGAANAFGGIIAVRALHRLFAIILVIVMFEHFISRVFVRRLRSKIWFRPKDVIGLIKTGLYHLGLVKIPPPKEFLGIHDPIAKMNYWIIAFFGVLFMVGTGTFLAFLPMTFSPWIWLMHGLGSAIGTAWWLFHAYFTLLVPIYRPVAKAMFIDGRVPLDWVKEERPAWYEELKKA